MNELTGVYKARVRERMFWFHWQNLNEKLSGRLGNPVRHGRAWLRIVGTTFGVEWRLRWGGLHASLTLKDREVMVGLAMPGLSLYGTIEGLRWLPMRDDRETSIALNDGALRLLFLYRIHDWRKGASLLEQGLEWTLNWKDILLGKCEVSTTPIETHEVQIPMVEGAYPATVTLSVRRWKRSRWFATEDLCADVEIPSGIPHPGKREDDSLFGFYCRVGTVEGAIAEVVRSVLKDRMNYGGSVNWVPLASRGV